jgi:hypothetical protein
VIIAVLLQLGFAAAFFVDANQTNRTYDALAAHRVVVMSHRIGCAYVGRPGRFGVNSGNVCEVGYSYRGEQFTAYIPFAQPGTFYVDPDNPAMRMSEVAFDKGPEQSTGDIVIAVLLVLGAVTVTAVHQVHLRRRSRYRHRTS